MKIQVETRYGIGDTIFFIEERAFHPECNVCQGTGNLELVIGGMVDCTACDGFKTNSKITDIRWVPMSPMEINGVSHYTEREDDIISCYVTYYGKGDFEGIEEGVVFDTCEEAEAECRRRNESLVDSD